MLQRWPDIINEAITSVLDQIHTAVPGRIESYDATTKKVSVTPLIRKWLADDTKMAFPVIDSVPVVFPSSEDFILSYPLKQGDGCLILFSERSLEYWLSSSGEFVDPGDPRKFSISDAICIPGLFSFGKPGKVGTGNEFELLYKGASIKIDVNGNIKFNGDSKTFVTHAELNTALQSFITALNLHVHSGVTTGPGASGTPGTPMSLDITSAKTTTIKTGG